MIRQGQVITVLLGVLVLGVTVHADLMPLSPLDAAGYWQSLQAKASTDLRPANPSTPVAGLPGMGDLDSLPVGFLPPPDAVAGPTSETKPAPILTDRQNSLTLCLYALFGLGLCRSVPLVKKLHFSCIPDWYHSGGPYQIGHSLVASPNCLPSMPVLCFCQPDSTAVARDTLLIFRHGIVVSCWRQSQFTPALLASRGPPSMS